LSEPVYSALLGDERRERYPQAGLAIFAREGRDLKVGPLDDGEKKRLLGKHNPVLILLPNDTSRKRPGALWKGTGRGDYHPCSAEFFLSQLKMHRKRRPWRPFAKAGQEEPDPPGCLQAQVANSLGATEDWELNLAAIKSGDPSQAWSTYGALLQDDPLARKCVVYGRAGLTNGRIFLQYWYLYLYNDAVNTHEGDWETVTVELNGGQQPVRVAYAGHEGGARRTWEGITRRGDRPVVFVARGSHAAYLEHMPIGHKTAHMNFEKNLPEPLQMFVATLQGVISRFFYFGGIRDYTSSLDDPDERSRGMEVSPEVRLMPDSAPLTSPTWWWLNLHCRWGSSRARLSEFLGPYPPWTKGTKWTHPLAWLDQQNER
jgi:hypothetical protein